MRLLFVIPEYPPGYGGGIGTYYGALLPALVRRGHHVEALVGSAYVRDGQAFEREGVRVRVLEGSRVDRAFGGYARYAPASDVRRHLAAAHALWEQAEGGEGFDAVEVTDWGLLFAPWVSRPGPPALVQFHASSGQIAAAEPDPTRALDRDVLRLLEYGLLSRASGRSAYGRPTATEWEARLGAPVSYVPPPLPPVSDVDAAPSETGFVAGRLQLWKGPDVLARALHQMGGAAPTVEWAGRAVDHPLTGEPFDAYLARCFPAVWGHSLRSVGLLPPEEVARRQAGAAFVVVPSRWDVFNYTAAEAMQHGAVVVCSEGAGAADLIEDGVSGFRVPADDAAALAEALRRAVALGPAERATMGAAARAVAVARLDPDRIAREKEALYEAVRAAPAPEVDVWLRDAVAPDPGAPDLGFLDHLPLRPLVGYAARRAWSAVRRTLRR